MTKSIILTILGVGMLILTVFLSINEYNFLQHSVESSGIVVSNVMSGVKSPTYHPVIKFKTSDGTDVQFTSSSGTNPPAYHVNQPVDIRYDPKNPQSAQIKSLFDEWGAPGIAGILGILFVIVGIFSTIGSFKQKMMQLSQAKAVVTAVKDAAAKSAQPGTPPPAGPATPGQPPILPRA